MNHSQSERNNRNKSLAAFRKKFRRQIASYPPLDRSFNTFMNLHMQVENMEAIASKDTKEETRLKAEARQALTIPALLVSGALFSAGLSTGNMDLKTRFNINQSEITKLSRQHMTDYVKDIISAAGQYIEDISRFDVTPESLPDLKKKLCEYEKAIEKQQSAQEMIHKAAAAIDPLLGQINDLIKNEINVRIQSFRKTDPEMYAEYITVRLVKNSTSLEKVKGN